MLFTIMYSVVQILLPTDLSAKDSHLFKLPIMHSKKCIRKSPHPLSSQLLFSCNMPFTSQPINFQDIFTTDIYKGKDCEKKNKKSANLSNSPFLCPPFTLDNDTYSLAQNSSTLDFPIAAEESPQ